MVKIQSGLGDVNIDDIERVTYILNHLPTNEEVSFTADLFNSGNLLETVFAAFEVLDYKLYFSAGVHKCFRNLDSNKTFDLDCRRDVIIIKNRKDIEYGRN